MAHSDPAFDVPWMTERTAAVILAAVAGDEEAVATAICQIGERYGGQGGYAMCCALAEAIAKMADLKLDGTGDFYGFELFDQRTGRTVSPDQAGNAQHGVAAMRFVIAHVNGDTEQKLALFDAPETPEQAMQLPLGLVQLVGAYGRAKIAEGNGDHR